ncbi:MAG: hypothetical protein HYV59_12570 [Planctomycetes bacterium]|nr:hypothetical protein [Planctomycetota bacterium]
MSIKKHIPWYGRWWAITIFVFIIAMIGSYLSENTTNKESAPKIYHTKGEHFVAISKEIFGKAQDYKIAKDLGALDELSATGKIFYLRPGTEVYRLDVTFTGLVKIRAKGTTIELWTYREEIY